MSNKWDIKDKGITSSSAAAAEALTMGLLSAPHRYEGTCKETGETREVTAFSVKGAGEKISKGNFSK